MAYSTATPPTTGEYAPGWYGNRKCREIRQRVQITSNAAYATISPKLPGRCKVLWAQLRVISAVGLGHSGNSGTSVLGDTFALCNSLPTTNDTSTTTTMVMLVSGSGATSTATSGSSRTISANTGESGVTAGAPELLNTGAVSYTGSSETTLYLVPLDNGGATDFSVQATTPTNGQYFATGEIDVQVFFEEYETNAPR